MAIYIDNRSGIINGSDQLLQIVCSVYLGTDQTGVSDNVSTTVELDTASIDAYDAYDTSTNHEYVIPDELDGMKFFANVQIRYDNVDADDTVTTSIQVDTGGGYSDVASVGSTCASANQVISGCVKLTYLGTLDAGDKIRVQGKCTDWGTNARFDSGFANTFLNIFVQ